MTHIAAQSVMVEGRYLRQRCAWCGEVLLDYDLANIATEDGSAPATFATGAMVTVDGNFQTMVKGFLPDDACCVLELTR